MHRGNRSIVLLFEANIFQSGVPRVHSWFDTKQTFALLSVDLQNLIKRALNHDPFRILHQHLARCATATTNV